ncbi:transketolase [Bacillus sp. AFS076308]|uniref:transketolase n=1 Tax=unclassified Bacillus (in: firmicutes) TaxID=185979 RepID=UPI000BF560AF|nr:MULTISPECIES: transketolase [unclassified Bacillus (in: firmicutes)]PFN98735.1 transketolase [Bacillus sp. AFS076308]PGV53485.1 transketolase [Bacillus sp. AFS037270]
MNEVTSMKDVGIKELKEKAIELRKTALTMIHEAQSGHPGGSLSAADVVAALYFREMNIDPNNPQWEDRDRFVLSKGHVCPIQYSALALRGYVPYDTIYTLRKFGSPFQGHPDMKKCPGIDISTGSLGQGLSCAVGMALGGKRDSKEYRVFAILGDGECQEGQIWEAAQSAVKYRLDNLVVFVDDNGLQIDGTTEEIMPNQDLEKKFQAFGFETRRIDGHSMEEIVETLDYIREAKNGKPKCIVLNTVKGKGVSFMEHSVGWHGVAPNDVEFLKAIEEVAGGLK